jgi:hypothetical protein
MKDIFGALENSSELQLFDNITSPYEYEVALALYRSYRAEGISEEESLELAIADKTPENWSSFSIGQSLEQQSN